MKFVKQKKKQRLNASADFTADDSAPFLFIIQPVQSLHKKYSQRYFLRRCGSAFTAAVPRKSHKVQAECYSKELSVCKYPRCDRAVRQH